MDNIEEILEFLEPYYDKVLKRIENDEKSINEINNIKYLLIVIIILLIIIIIGYLYIHKNKI